MKFDHCPHCRTRSGLTRYCTLLLSLDRWPLATVYSMLVLIFAKKLSFDGIHTAGFVALAVLPLLFRVINKQACDNCGAEFRTSSDFPESEQTDLP